jgi:hypothetical protein
MLRWLPTRSLVKCVQFSGNSTNGLHTYRERRFRTGMLKACNDARASF